MSSRSGGGGKGRRGSGGGQSTGGAKNSGGGRRSGSGGGRRSGGGPAGGAGAKGSRKRSSQGGGGSRRGSGAPRKRPGGLDGTQVEGRQAVRELLLAGRRRVREVYVGNDVERADVVEDIVSLAAELKVPVREVSRSKIDHLSSTDAPQGVVAFADQIPGDELSALCSGDTGRPFLLALDGVTDPGNLGALLRIAECAGVTGVVIPRHRAARVTPTVAKAAVGAAEYLPMALVGGLPAAMEEMRAAGIWVVGLDAGGDTSIHDLELGAESVCLVLGAEGPGLSRLVRERCDLVASIPLLGQLASLNVASAGAVACYEVARRRS
ncbi:MAG: 23S rRNA (guanosine(2251)-2'-O)-methyltransferase RlmB [Microthrixaceae bacterium]